MVTLGSIVGSSRERGPRRLAALDPASAQAAIPFDTGLVRSARNGNRAAFARLWAVHEPAVRAVTASLLPRHLVDDALQEVALAALGALPSLRKETGFAAWLCAIARNRARTLYTRQRRGATAADMDCLPAAERIGAGAETDEAVAALRGLPATYREPLALRLLAGLSPPDIARRLGMTAGSVRVNLCRGLKLLRERFATCLS